MKHYVVSAREITPWTTSEFPRPSLRVRQVLTVHRGLAFFLDYQQPVHVGYCHNDNLGRGLLILQSRLKGDLTKKNCSDLIAASARRALDDLREDFHAVDGLPWEIHTIDDRVARESAAKHYWKESGAKPVDVDLRYWNAFFRRSR